MQLEEKYKRKNQICYNSTMEGNMVVIKKQYIRDKDGKPVAVVVDLETFKEIEELLEDIDDLKIVEERFDEEDLNWDEVKSEID